MIQGLTKEKICVKYIRVKSDPTQDRTGDLLRVKQTS